MPDFAALLQQGAGQAWLFVPSAILLGALHGLEPGHSKTMMAAFIVAIRGSVLQAVLLGLAATVSPAYVAVLAERLGLEMRRIVGPEVVRQVCLYRSTRRASPAAEGVAEHLVAWLRG